MSFSKKRLRLALDLRGLNNSKFSELLGCSVSKVKMLLDEDRIISIEDKEKIYQALNMPAYFFEYDDKDDEFGVVKTSEIFYRSVARIKSSYKQSNEAFIILVKMINQYFINKFNLPKFHISELEIDNDWYVPNSKIDTSDSYRAITLASELRNKWGLGFQPIHNMISLCELHGIKVFRLPMEFQEIDALSFFDEENGCPVIFLNTFKSAERMRFDCAHELGHIIMHVYDKDIKKNRNNKDLEKEADLFASEFLMPEEAFIASCPRYLSLENMMNVKKKWRTSLKAVNYKANKLGLISEWVYRSNSMKINTMGYHLNEPEETHRDESIMLPKIMELLASQPDFNKEKMLNEMRISEDDFNSLTFDVLKKWEDSQKPKFYFVD